MVSRYYKTDMLRDIERLLSCHLCVTCENKTSGIKENRYGQDTVLQNVTYRQLLSSTIFVRHFYINLLKPTGHVMHHQFNIQQLYVLPTLYLCVLYLSENKQRLVPLTA